MTDKGFTIDEDCNDAAIELIRPPFLGKRKKLTKYEVQQNESIASARVHVERVIQRMKTFAILKHTFPWELVNRADNIVHVICGLVNLQSPIIDFERVILYIRPFFDVKKYVLFVNTGNLSCF